MGNVDAQPCPALPAWLKSVLPDWTACQVPVLLMDTAGCLPLPPNACSTWRACSLWGAWLTCTAGCRRAPACCTCRCTKCSTTSAQQK
jgi:hypothetical protein